MGTDLLSRWGLRTVQLSDQTTLSPLLQSIPDPLSDYTFSQLYSWSNSLRILWTRIGGHLCVFANGAGDLTLLMPPIGDTRSDRALEACFELMREYNAAAGCPEQSRVEYASEPLLARFNRANYHIIPQGQDYLYDVNRMVDLAGSELASKRQLKNRFMRQYDYYVEMYDASRHLQSCLQLLDEWKQHQDAGDASAGSTGALKRIKESIACRTALLDAAALGYAGMVVHVREKSDTLAGAAPRWDGFALRGFTFGEHLGTDQASIVIEKTDLTIRGLAQFIYSEFCARAFPHRPWINAGDDWGIESLAWTKQSYRPARLLPKYILHPLPTTAVAVSHTPQPAAISRIESPPPIRPATLADLPALTTLESNCFSTYSLKKRQLHHLLRSSTAICVVIEENGRLIAEGIALVRHHKSGVSGRIYSLAVDPAARGRGLGAAVMNALLARLAERGARRTYLEVEDGNRPAIRLYERLGFHSIGKLPSYYGDQHDGIHMMRGPVHSPLPMLS